MSRFLATIILQDVENEDIYAELDKAIINEDGYPYITDEDDKMYALPPDMYEFEVESTTQQMHGIISLICTAIEKKHNLKKTLIVVAEFSELDFSNLIELQDEDFEILN